MKDSQYHSKTQDVPVPNGFVRLAGLLLTAATVWYLWWLFDHINWQAPWVSVPFALASVAAAAMFGVTLVNQWHLAEPVPAPLPRGSEPAVAVIIPTLGEPPQMVEKTARSVLDQDYPQHQIHLIVSDDAHSGRMRAMVQSLQAPYAAAKVSYHSPPRRGDPQRRGEAKAGNLNSVLDALDTYSPGVEFVETRDADDMLDGPDFLRQTVGQLVARPHAAFVQTIKDARVTEGDPFGNRERFFYHRLMLAKHAANAVFPCGSGLVWRHSALQDIGGFPAWNLVEDLQSGVEALRKGWRSIYLPIVGAVSQSPPEDLPNVIKQRGTWAIDTMRLLLWRPLRGMRPRQCLHFAEMGIFYCLSFAFLVFAITPSLSLIANQFPVAASGTDYALHFVPYLLATELWLVALFGKLPYRDLWRSRQMWTGLAPVFAKATLLAVRYGPRHKPSYRVTRKENIHRWYWGQVLPQTTIVLLFLLAVAHHVVTHGLFSGALLPSVAWGALWLILLSHTIKTSWHGMAMAEPAMGTAAAHPLLSAGDSVAQAKGRRRHHHSTADALYRLSRQQLLLGEVEEAVKGMEEVLRIWPDRQDVRETLEEALRQLPGPRTEHPATVSSRRPATKARRWRLALCILATAVAVVAALWLAYVFLILPLRATSQSSDGRLSPAASVGLASRIEQWPEPRSAVYVQSYAAGADAPVSAAPRQLQTPPAPASGGGVAMLESGGQL